MSKSKRIILLIFCLAILVSCIVGTSLFAYADDLGATVAVADLDNTDVLADLMTDENFNIYDYNWSTGGVPKMISFVEYCYSPIQNYKKLYGLYVYIFNPGGYILETDGHSINIATTYVLGIDGVMRPSQYEAFELKLISISGNLVDSPTKTYNMFWKFKVVDKRSEYDGLTIQERVNPTVRQYDIAGFQLLSSSTNNMYASLGVRDFHEGGQYLFSGYATGMYSDTSIPLECKREELDVVDLDVKSTYYRTLTHSKGNGWQNDLHSVYFSVPKSFFNKYGEIKRIKAEWYEFISKKMVVTRNSDFYTQAVNFIGKGSSDKNTIFWNSDPSKPPSSYVANLTWLAIAGAKRVVTGTPITPIFTGFTGSWGWGNTTHMSDFYIDLDAEEYLWYLFLTSNYATYDPELPLNLQGGISAQEVGSYIENFTKNYASVCGETFNVGSLILSKNLFESNIGSRATKNNFGVIQCGFDGKSTYEFDVEIGGHLSYETFDWKNASFSEKVAMLDGSKHPNWDVFLNNIPDKEMDASQIDYITTIDVNDCSSSLDDKSFVSKYLVNERDVDIIQNFVLEEHNKNNVVILFRYAVTDYWAEELCLLEMDSSTSRKYEDNLLTRQGYVAQSSLFLNFDIISLTFKNDIGAYTTLGVVADPINIYPDLTPPVKIEPPNNDSLWTRILTIIMLGALIFFVGFICWQTFKVVFNKK